MKTTEKENDEKKCEETSPNMSCCGTQSSDETMPDCCKSIGEDDNHRSIMSTCMKGCRWFPFVPVVLGTALLLMGYFLNPEITRILWMIAAGFGILLGTLGLVMMGRMKKMCCGS
jgi:hypothetical protein